MILDVFTSWFFWGCLGVLIVTVWLPEVIMELPSRFFESKKEKMVIADTDLTPEGFVMVDGKLKFARMRSETATKGDTLVVRKRRRDYLEVSTPK